MTSIERFRSALAAHPRSGVRRDPPPAPDPRSWRAIGFVAIAAALTSLLIVGFLHG